MTIGWPGRGQRGLGGQQLRGRADVLGVLPAVAADALAEIRLAVEEADRHQRQPQVGRALEVVARQHARGRRSRSGAIRGCRTRRRSRRPGARAAAPRDVSAQVLAAAQVVAQLAVGAVDAGPQRGVARQLARSARAASDAPSTGALWFAARNSSGSRSRNKLDDVRVPRPPQIARQLRELGSSAFPEGTSVWPSL